MSEDTSYPADPIYESRLMGFAEAWDHCAAELLQARADRDRYYSQLMLTLDAARDAGLGARLDDAIGARRNRVVSDALHRADDDGALLTEGDVWAVVLDASTPRQARRAA